MLKISADGLRLFGLFLWHEYKQLPEILFYAVDGCFDIIIVSRQKGRT